jgi:site-specific DNA recombinase
MKVAVYARVSTTNHGQDSGLQTREQHQFAEARGWQVFDDYIDEGVSGSKDSRPELNRLMADAHKRRFDVVCVEIRPFRKIGFSSTESLGNIPGARN